MTGLHAALAELAAEWADRTPRSDAPRDRRECATVLRALLAEHEPSEITYTYFDRYAYDPMTKASQRLRDEGGVVLDAAGNLVGRVGPARPGNTEGEQVADFAILEREPSGQVDHEQPYRDLRAAIKTLASDMHRGWKHVRDGADAAFLIAKMLDDLASSAPTTASEGAHRCDTCEDTGRVAWMSESDPHLYSPPDEDGTIPCPDCGPATASEGHSAVGEHTWTPEEPCPCGQHDTCPATPATASGGATEGSSGNPIRVPVADFVQRAIRDHPATGVTSSDGSSKPGSSLEDAGSTDGDREGLSDEERETLTVALYGVDRAARIDGDGPVYAAVESILAARLAEVTAERDEAKAERDEARAVRAWVGERGDDHLDRVLRKTTHCDCGGWDQVFELQTESPRPLFGGIRPWKYAGITLKGQSSHARACPKSWRNSPDEKLAHTEARADALAEQVAAIQALHRPDGGIDGPGAMCVSCTADFGTPAEDPTPWPCPTAVVLADPGSALAARDTKVAAQARAELLAKVQDVYDLQCPVRPSEDYTHPAARVAHKWWQTVLGGLLDRERAAGGEVEQP